MSLQYVICYNRFLAGYSVSKMQNIAFQVESTHESLYPDALKKYSKYY